MTVDPSPSVPLYRRLFETYREQVLSLQLPAGSRIDSITEMQRKHGVARETAKRVLKMLADEGYVVQYRGRGSFVADIQPKEPVWGLIFPFFSFQYEDLILRVSHLAAGEGREVRKFCDYNSWQEELRLVRMMLQERYEAVIVIPTLDESKTRDFYSKLSAHEGLVVLFDHTMTCDPFRYVIQSYDLGVTRALNHLLADDAGGVAFVENEGWGGRNMVLELMRGTYLDHLAKRRPNLEPLIIPRGAAVHARQLRERGITSLFCCDDVSAIQAIGRLREQGAEVPRDFGVVSYGNTDLARFFTPAISSVDPRNEEMTEILGEVIARSFEAPGSGKHEHVVQPELIIRAT